MNIVFMGTSTFAIPALERVAASGHAVALVVTRPARERGRGRKAQPSPISVRAHALGLETYEPARVNAPDAVERVRASGPDLIVVVAYGQILRAPLLSMAPRGIVNLHGSLLPRWRGAAPIARAIQYGDSETGASLQFIAPELDAGDVIGTVRMPILPTDTTGSLGDRMAVCAAELLERHLPALARGDVPRVPQDPALVTLAPPLAKDEGRVPWTRSALEIDRHVRAMTPWPGAFADLELTGRAPERIVVRAVTPRPGAARSAEPGRIVPDPAQLLISCADGVVRVDRLLRAGRKEMEAAAFLRGFTVDAAARFR